MNPAAHRTSGDEGLEVRWRGSVSRGITSGEVASVLAAVAHERHAAENGDVESYLHVFAVDAAQLRPNADVERGAAMRAAARDFLHRFRVTWLRFVTTDVAVIGDIAYHEYVYSWKLTPRSGGNASIESGTAYHVLSRGADGSWRIKKEVWSAVRPGVSDVTASRDLELPLHSAAPPSAK